ncbi:PIN domain-containing protein [Nioella sp. MMSF_3534]|uniref:PIN domain-containing protein n=1 Tax=Nioella sp. MMSF_3534 TaxID=3046720 RepID=UPI00273FD128|nr:PIN domain-containing protein [Nioella sp. MMSF_3534]
MSAEFADTNIVLSLLDDGPKADRAEAILGQGPRISVQVLNEALVNCRRKAGLSWDETGAFLASIQVLCPVEELTMRTHEVGRALAERYGFSVYDAMIVSAALIAGCTTLWTEDMQDGLLVEGRLRIINPFAQV